MRSVWLAALLCVALLAGCSSKDKNDGQAAPQEPTAGPEYYAPIVAPVVHRSDGRVVAASEYPGEIPVFAERYVAQRGGGEPTIAVNARGQAIFPTIAFDVNGVATSLASTQVYATSDDGLNWTEVTPTTGGLSDAPKAAPTSLDPYVYADPVTGRLFNIDLNLAYGAFLSWTDDGGQTWTNNPNCCGVPVDDHQTLFSGPATVVPANPLLYPGRLLYYCINQIGSSTCTRSNDGGLTWSAPTSSYPGYEPPGEGNDCTPSSPADPTPALNCLCGGLHGHGHASEVTGTIWVPKGQCGRAEVSRSDDNGLTWNEVIVDNTVGIDGHEAIVSTDKAGNVYYFFLDGNALPRLSISRDDGRSWSSPINVTAPGVTLAKFPSIVAGDTGHIAFLYLGTTSPAGRHMYEDGNESFAENATWNAYVGFSLDALAEDPVFATVTAHNATDMLHRGDCAGRCQVANGGMYDFLDIDIRPDNGQVWVALIDNCNGDTPYNSPPCNGPDGTVDSYRRARAAVGVQVGGTLLGSALP